MRRRVGRRGAARDRRPPPPPPAAASRPCSSARPTRDAASRCRGARAPRRRPSPSPARGGGTSGTTSPVESPSFGTRISVSSSPCADRRLEDAGEEVGGSDRPLASRRRRSTNSAPSASITAGRSEAGSPWASEPPIVPRCRTCGSPTFPAVVETIGQCSCSSGSRCTAACRVSAPIASCEPASRT